MTNGKNMGLAMCPCGFVPRAGVSPTSADYHRGHREVHLKKYPNAGETTKSALDELVAMAERRDLVDAEDPRRARMAGGAS